MLVKEAEDLKTYLKDLIEREKRSLRHIRPDLEEIFPKGLDPAGPQAMITGARLLITRIWGKKIRKGKEGGPRRIRRLKEPGGPVLRPRG